MRINSYPAQLLSIHDGDTVRLRVCLGFDVQIERRVRLAGINAPELPSAAGLAALTALTALLARPGKLMLMTPSDAEDNYGRPLGWLMLSGNCLNLEMIYSGHAVPLGPYPSHPPLMPNGNKA